MSSHVLTASVIGLDAHLVEVEADLSLGIPAFSVVGLPDAAVQEARERVRSAMKHAGLDFPRGRVTINLAPANLKKTGTPYDLPIALAIWMGKITLPEPQPKRLFAGELGLDGSLRPIHGALSFAMLAKELGMDELVVPEANGKEAALVSGLCVRTATHLSQVIAAISGQSELSIQSRSTNLDQHSSAGLDFSGIRGQSQARRAMEIAAAGGHNLVMQGPPGSGKTLLARSFPSILPHVTEQEALEITRIHSVAGLLNQEGIMNERPFRAPHHSASMASLIGGGSIPRPGEVSLAHRGVLFLDEFLEFNRAVLESLRQPLEDGVVTVSRAHGSVSYPARFMLLAALNPCPCGYLTDPDQTCRCSPIQIANYTKRLSGPLLDRMDLFIEVGKVKTDELLDRDTNENSQTIRARVQAARDRQQTRWQSLGKTCNAELSSDEVRRHLIVAPDAEELLKQAINRFSLSARAYFRLLKVAQTIADLEASDQINLTHVAESLQYRQSIGKA